MTKRITLCAASAAAGLAALIAVAGTANAAVSPNYARYCASQHPGSFVSTSNLTGEKLCTQRTYGGYGLRHYRINLALACRLTTGSTAYRNYGRGFVQCATQASVPNPGPRVAERTPDLTGYCRRLYYGAQASFSYQLRRWVCSQRTYNGLGLRHYTVNMVQACVMSYRTTAVRYIGNDPRYPRCLVRA